MMLSRITASALSLAALLTCACGGAVVQPTPAPVASQVTYAYSGCHYGDEAGCKASCEHGNNEDCASLAVMLLHGDGVSIDLVRSRKVAESSCTAGSMRGCNALGLLLERGDGGPKDETRALSLYTRACDHDEWRGCANLGESQSFGRNGLTPNAGKAVDYFERACRLGNPKSCLNAATRLTPGADDVEDLPRAATLFGLACDGGDMEGCSGLGACYARGAGVPRDEQRASALLRQGCEGRAGIGCKGLGDLAALSDPAKAASLYQRSCDLGYTGGCAYLGDALIAGRGVPRDRDRGTTLLRTACDQQYKWACERLKALVPSYPLRSP